jgi:hypothetical protein
MVRSGWADRTLRHPFTRAALLQTVDRLAYSEDLAPASDDRPRPDDMQLKTGSQA